MIASDNQMAHFVPNRCQYPPSVELYYRAPE
jgi:hypothetical protein